MRTGQANTPCERKNGMIVNADRKGPKDMLDLAHKANAYKNLLDARDAHVATGSPATQKGVDDAFEAFSDLHRGEDGNVNTGDMQATMGYIDALRAKGKSH
jgi:hypothetical protein